MSLSPTDFIAENVEVLAKYIVNDNQQWCTGIIVNVFEHGVKRGHHYVECEVEYADEKVDEVFWDYDYETSTEDAWRFSSNYKPLVKHVLALDEELNQDDDETEDEAETEAEDTEGDDETEYEPSDCTDCTDTTSDGTEEEETDEEDVEYIVYEKRPQSFFKRVLATLFTLSPTILSALVIYHAREDIAYAIRRKICL